MYSSEKSTAVTRYLQPKVAVVEVMSGETRKEAWRRYLTINPGYANAHVRIFHYPTQASLHNAPGRS